MSAKHWIIGCALGLAGTGSVMAADGCHGDAISSVHAVAAESSTHDAGGGNGGDTVVFTHDRSATRHSSENTSTDNANEAGESGAGSAERAEHGASGGAPTGQSHLGWQSLLPGSIQ